MTKLLDEAYDLEKFREIGHELVDLISEHLADSQETRRKVSNWSEPNDQLRFWEGYDFQTPKGFFKDVLQNSISVHHPKYIGHQI
ncbi:MAG: hypothetical protein AAFN93_10460 [Bacteroidota bacterium]